MCVYVVVLNTLLKRIPVIFVALICLYRCVDNQYNSLGPNAIL